MNSTTKTILNKEIIQRIMEKHFGDIQVQNVSELTEGWFNAIYIVDYIKDEEDYSVVLKTGVEEGKYVLSYEKDLIRAELQVYDLLKNTIIPTANILARDFTCDMINCNYFIMERMMGDNWGRLESQLTEENKDILVAELAQYTAALHQIKGNYFGYLKNDSSYHYPTWKEAFQGMIHMMIEDGKEQKLDLPYEEFLEVLSPYWYLLDDIKESSLVNFDMWTKNIMLKQEADGFYHIDAIIDLERAFYGDPYAEFISSNTIVGDVSNSHIFMENYSKISGKDFAYTKRNHVRLIMYFIYIILMMGVEDYRKTEEEEKERSLEECRNGIRYYGAKLKEAAKDLLK